MCSNKINKESITGIVVFLVAFGAIAAATGVYGVIYVGLAFVLAVISISLFSRKSVLAKTGAVVLNTDLIYKILMPRKHKNAIKKLKEKEQDEKT